MIYFVIDPYADKVISAYSPIIYSIQDDGLSGLGGVPPVIYCDVYFNGTYYKTLTSTSPFAPIGVVSIWQIDISGLAQEYIQTLIPDITTSLPQTVYSPGFTAYGATTAYIKARYSTVDAYGVITPSGTPPVQATMDSSAIAGSGYVTGTCVIANAAQQVTDLMNFEDQLKAFRPTGIPGLLVNVANRVYPLTYLKRGNVFTNDCAIMAFICSKNAFVTYSGMVDNIPIRLYVNMYQGSTLLYSGFTIAGVLTGQSVYTMPIGIKNLLIDIPGMVPYIGTCEYYHAYLVDSSFSSGNPVLFATPPIYINKQIDGTIPGITTLVNPAAPKHTRIWFQNYLGQFDAINFIEREETLKVTASPSEKPLQQMISVTDRTRTSMSRNNVRSNEFNTVTDLFTESELPLVKQLLASTKTYIEFVSPETDFLPQVMMLPIVLIEGEYPTQLFDERYEYRLSIKYFLSNEFKIVRN